MGLLHVLHLVGQPLTTEAMDENLPWRRGRLVLLGQGRAGKTSTVRSLVGKPFDKSQSLGRCKGHGWTRDLAIDGERQM